ncbi:hypothetical protein K8353_43455, partial [Burkholderia contaminans]|nr:hypothetical protein [Burkholderia contaminans]
MGAKKQHVTALPYGCLITKLLEREGVDVSKEEKVTLKASDRYGSTHMLHMGFKRTENKGWIRVEELSLGDTLWGGQKIESEDHLSSILRPSDLKRESRNAGATEQSSQQSQTHV